MAILFMPIVIDLEKNVNPLSFLQKFQKSIEKKSSPQELERIRTKFFISVPFGAFLEMVLISWAYKSPVPQPFGSGLKLLLDELD